MSATLTIAEHRFGKQENWGFTPWSMALYKITETNHDLFLSDEQLGNLSRSNGVFREIIGNKAVAHFVLPEFQPECYASIEDGKLDGLDSVTVPCFVKPAMGWNGSGVSYHADGVSADEVKKLVDSGDEWIIEEALIQHQYASDIWPHSFNTIRFMTYRGDKTCKIAAVCHKWGTRATGHVDNFLQGGVSTYIEHGVLGYTREDFTLVEQRLDFNGQRIGSNRVGKYSYPYTYHNHPESGIPIFGKLVPFWEETRAIVIDAANRLHDGAFLQLIGFDVMITKNGPKIVDINTEPLAQLLQVHVPLLDHLDFKKFVEKWQPNEI